MHLLNAKDPVDEISTGSLCLLLTSLALPYIFGGLLLHVIA